MKIHIWIVIGLFIVALGLGLFFGDMMGKQVVDGNGKHVKGKFVSNDGVNATLKTSIEKKDGEKKV